MNTINQFISLYKTALKKYDHTYHFEYDEGSDLLSYDNTPSTKLQHDESLELYLQKIKALLTHNMTFNFKTLSTNNDYSSSNYVPHYFKTEKLFDVLLDDSLIINKEDLNYIGEYLLPKVNLHTALEYLSNKPGSLYNNDPYSASNQKALCLFEHWHKKTWMFKDVNLNIIKLINFTFPPKQFYTPFKNYLLEYMDTFNAPPPKTLQDKIISIVKKNFPVEQWVDFSPFFPDLYEPATENSQPLISYGTNHISQFSINHNALKQKHSEIVTEEDLRSALNLWKIINDPELLKINNLYLKSYDHESSYFIIESINHLPSNKEFLANLILSCVEQYFQQGFDKSTKVTELTEFFIPFVKSEVLRHKLPEKLPGGSKFKI